ncbi:MAG: hypothetical protein V4479_06660 [Actinomycetota bacterium]
MPHTKWSRAIIIAVGAAAVVTLILIAFIWPSLTSTVRNVPLAVVGTSSEVSSVTTQLDDKLAGGFVITKVPSRASAVHAIKTRDELGAIIMGGSPEVLVASAAGTPVSQLLTQLAAQIQATANASAQAAVAQAIAAHHAPAGTIAPTITVTVTDVVPLVAADSRGVGLAAASFPLVLGGMLGGIMISLLITGVWRRLISVIVYAVIAGAAVVAVMQGWFGVLQGSVLLNAAAVSLAMAATAAFIVGANALTGIAGIPLGSVVTMLIGNPLSSATAPIAFMPQPWGQVGQYFVPGASATLLRDLSYFPDAGTLMPWLVLAGWTVLGVLAMVGGHFRNQEVVHVPALEEQPA